MSCDETVILNRFYMIKVVRKVLVTAAILMTCSLEVMAGTKGKESSFDWNPVMNAIIQVESGGNPRAVSGPSVGAMQITPICVRECNNILQKRKSKKRYTMNDLRGTEVSITQERLLSVITRR